MRRPLALLAALLTAYDGEATGGDGIDKFRIKIWSLTPGDLAYDNQVGASEDSDAATVLGGGSIEVHQK